jgi:hypothetical protein
MLERIRLTTYRSLCRRKRRLASDERCSGHPRSSVFSVLLVDLDNVQFSYHQFGNVDECRSQRWRLQRLSLAVLVSSQPGPFTTMPDIDEKQCRICFDGANVEPEMGRLIRPCLCKGSISVSNGTSQSPR